MTKDHNAGPSAQAVPPSASAAERAQIYQEIHGDVLNHYNATRQIEWIVNGALWAGVVVAGGQAAGHVDLSWLTRWQILVAGLIGGALHYLLWMYPIQCSENADGEMVRRHLELAHLALHDSDLKQPNDAQVVKLKAALPTRVNKSIYHRFGSWFLGGWLRGFEWALIECGTTTILIWAVLAFLKNIPWKLAA